MNGWAFATNVHIGGVDEWTPSAMEEVSFPPPSDYSVVVAARGRRHRAMRVLGQLDREFAQLRRSRGRVGAITFARRRQPGEIVYVGPLPLGAEQRLREIVRPLRLEVAAVRRPDPLEECQVSTG